MEKVDTFYFFKKKMDIIILSFNIKGIYKWRDNSTYSGDWQENKISGYVSK